MNRVRGNLPAPLTTLIERRELQQNVRRELRRSRLLTLTGFGGIGKSRLALVVGASLTDEFPDGVWLVELAPVQAGASPYEVTLATISAETFSSVPASQALIEQLRTKQALLILDNCEHITMWVLEMAARILEAAPQVRILATSRERLGGAGERVMDVPPLDFPSADPCLKPAEIEHYESVKFLSDRATAIRPDFALTEQNVASVVKLCRILGGNPLAIELAASRLRSLSIGELVNRLSDQFSTLEHGDPTAPARQRSLRGLVQWSWDLCGPAEQMLWARCSVFAGSFGLEAAEVICADVKVPRAAVLELLDRLVSKSILKAEMTADSTRYWFLETLKQYGESKLGQSANELARVHRDYFADLAVAALEHWSGSLQGEYIDRVRVEHHEFRKALEWSFSTADEYLVGARMVNALRFHWAVGGHLVEGADWLHRSLELNTDPNQERRTALWVAAWVTLASGDPIGADRYLIEAHELSQAAGDTAVRSYVLGVRGATALTRGELQPAVEQLGQAVRELEEAGDIAGYLLHSMQYVICLAQLGRSQEAQDEGQRALSISKNSGELWGQSQLLWALGYDAWLQESPHEAVRLIRESLRMRLSFNLVGTALDLEALAWVEQSRGDSLRSIRLFAISGKLWDRLRTRSAAMGFQFGIHTSRALEELRMGPLRADFDTVTERARGWSQPDAISFALTGTLPEGAEPGRQGNVSLTRRERQIAQLVAEGLSNREIAEQLVLSSRTVEGHVENVLMKFGFRSRVQIAAHIASGLER